MFAIREIFLDVGLFPWRVTASLQAVLVLVSNEIIIFGADKFAGGHIEENPNEAKPIAYLHNFRIPDCHNSHQFHIGSGELP